MWSITKEPQWKVKLHICIYINRRNNENVAMNIKTVWRILKVIPFKSVTDKIQYVFVSVLAHKIVVWTKL